MPTAPPAPPADRSPSRFAHASTWSGSPQGNRQIHYASEVSGPLIRNYNLRAPASSVFLTASFRFPGPATEPATYQESRILGSRLRDTPGMTEPESTSAQPLP